MKLVHCRTLATVLMWCPANEFAFDSYAERDILSGATNIRSKKKHFKRMLQLRKLRKTLLQPTKSNKRLLTMFEIR